MAFWNRRKRNGGGADRCVMIRGGKQLEQGVGRTLSENRRAIRSLDAPASLGRVFGGPLGGLQSGFAYSGRNRGDFFRWLRDKVPIISAGVWSWVRLTATPTTTLIAGKTSERIKAEAILANLDRRILETPFGRGSGLSKLTDAYFLELFTTGRFAGEAVLSEDGRSIDHFRFIDGYKVGWEHTEKGWTPFAQVDKWASGQVDTPPSPHPQAGGDREEVERFDPKMFFYGTLGTDITNPQGVEPLAAIPWVTEIQEVMLDDMARSSHNAGTPRMQVKIGRPERFSWEGDSEYTDRANRFFEQLVSQFTRLEPDDNIFT